MNILSLVYGLVVEFNQQHFNPTSFFSEMGSHCRTPSDSFFVEPNIAAYDALWSIPCSAILRFHTRDFTQQFWAPASQALPATPSPLLRGPTSTQGGSWRYKLIPLCPFLTHICDPINFFESHSNNSTANTVWDFQTALHFFLRCRFSR